MRRIFLSLSLLLAFNILNAEKVHIINSGLSDESYDVSLISSTDDNIVMSLSINTFFTHKVETPRGEAYVITADDMAPLSKAGQPNIPTLSIPVIVSDHSRMDVRIVETEYIDYHDFDIAPSKGDFPRSINPEDVPFSYGEEYNKDAFFPSTYVNLDSPYILRDFRGQNVKVTPFAYNPITRVLRVYNKMTIEVYSSSDRGENEKDRHSEIIRIDNDFEQIYGSRFINYQESNAKYTVVGEEGDLLIICHDAFMAAMEPFVEWKNTIGRRTTIVGTSVTGTSTDNIKAYISDQYDENPNLTHVLLVGDVAHIPGKYINFTGYPGCSDWWYGQLSGDDYYNELIVGRFSVESVDDVTNHVNKVIHYERDIDTSDTWLKVGQGVSKRENMYGHFGEDDYEHIDNIREDLLEYNYTTVHRDYDNVNGVSSSAAMVSEHINNGVSIINYCNHGSPTSWGVFSYSNSHINQLVNDNKLPFIISVACNNGQYDYYSGVCFAEAWLRAKNNTNGNPTGAIGGMFSYISQPWIPPMYGQDEMVDILVESYSNNIKRTMGGVALNGNMKVLDYGGSQPDYCATYNTWNLFGDPTLTLRNDIPEDMQVSHNEEMGVSSTVFVVNAVDAEGAVATLTKEGEIIGSAVVEDGEAVISFESLAAGEVNLTVFGYNKITYINTVDVVEGGSEALVVEVVADPMIISGGSSSYLRANVSGGTGSYTYLWSPSSGLNNPNIQSPIASPAETTTYTCTVVSGSESDAASVTIIVVLPPTDLSAEVDGANVELTWHAPDYVDTYNIYRDGELIASDVVDESYTDVGLGEGLYEYTVTSVYEDIESLSSTIATAIVYDLTVTTYANPSIIGEGSQTAISAYASGASGTVTYSWTPANSLENPNSSTTAAFPTETTTYTVTATCGNQSATADLTVYVVEIPEGFTATVDGNNIILEWDEVDLAEYYVVMRDDYVLNSYVPETRYVDDELEAGTYCYSVKSVKDIIVTPESEEVCREVEDNGCVPPGDITAQYYWCDDEFGALINWNRMESPLTLTEYRVYRSDDNIDYELVGTLANVPGLNQYQFSDMTNTVGRYYYKVSAYYASIDCESEFGMSANSSNDYVVVEMTSIEENQGKYVMMYPNPVKDVLKVKAEHMTSLTIVNIMGQVVVRQDVESDEVVLELGYLQSGIYLVRIETLSGVVTRQINIID